MNLFIFNKILDDPVISNLLKFKTDNCTDSYYTAMQGLISYSPNRLTDKNIIREYVLRKMLEQDSLPNVTELRNFLRSDIKNIYSVFFETQWDELCQQQGLVPPCDITVKAKTPEILSYAGSLGAMIDSTSNEALGGAILAHAETLGTGTVTAHTSFNWDGTALLPVSFAPIFSDSPADWSDDIRKIIDNTENFIYEKPAKNMVFQKKHKTEVCACINSCVDLFKDTGLRLIHLKASQLQDLSRLAHYLTNELLKYIIYIDDVSQNTADTVINTLHCSKLIIYAVTEDNKSI